MRILLAIPYNRSYVVMPSLGLGYLASIARDLGHEVEIADFIKDEIPPGDFRDWVKGRKYDLIGFQMMTYDLSNVRSYLEILQAMDPRPVTLIGGSHPSGDPQGVLIQLPQADYAMRGEAETAFPKFLDLLAGRRSEADVPNLVYREGGEIRTNPVELPQDLNALPFPAWDLMDPRTYPPAPHGAFAKSFPFAPIIITRGCPCRCTFCSGAAITGGKLRERSVENVLAEIDLLGSRYGVHEIMVEDENFTLRRGLLERFCEALIRRRPRTSWSCPSGVRVDTLTPELVRLMEASGCHSLSLGLEFGTQRMLDLTCKRSSLPLIREKVGLFRTSSIRLTGFFLLGCPGETEEDIRETVRFSRTLPLHRVQYNNFMPLPGSEMYDDLIKSGRITRESLDTDHFFVHDEGYVPDGMKPGALKSIQRNAYLRFYLRPRIIYRLLRDIDSPRHLYYLASRFLDAMRG